MLFQQLTGGEMVRVEVFPLDENCWCLHSRHKNKEYAVINAEVVHKSQGCDVRVIENGEIILFLEGV